MEAKRNKLKRHFELMSFYAKLDLAWLLRDTKYAVLNITADVVSSLAAVSSIFLLAMRFEGIGGMDKFEVLFMMGYVTCVTGLFQLFFAMNNVGHISRRIGRGQLEHMVIQPIPYAEQLSTEGFIPFTGSSNLFCGVGVVTFSIVKLGITPPVWWYLAFAGYLLLSVAILLLQSYFASSFTFYAPQALEEISSIAIDELGSLGNYPLSAMPKWLKLPLITILPYGLLGWLPSMILLGHSPFILAKWLPLIVFGALLIVTALLFRKGLRHYVKTGTNRYKDIGHRR